MSQQFKDYMQLLGSVVPVFLKLCAFNKHAAQEKRGSLIRFFLALHAELFCLGNNLSSWNPKADFNLQTLTRALDVLESRFFKRPTSNFHPLVKYPNLRLLRERNDNLRRIPNNHDGGLGLEELRHLIYLADDEKENRDRFVKRLAKLNGLLMRSLTGISGVDRLSNVERGVQDLNTDRARASDLCSSPSQNIRDHITFLYELLKQGWNCEGHPPHTTVNLRLATHRKNNPDTSFKMLFSCPSSGKWQESHVRFASKSRILATAKPPLSSTAPEEPRCEVDSICRLVHSTREPSQLNLLVEDDKLWHLSPSYINPQSWREDKVLLSLEQFLELHTTIPDEIKIREKLILQVILANALLHCYRGPWLLKSWDKSHICFYQARDEAVLDLTKPYLSTQCKPLEEVDSEEQDQNRMHPYPGILALGILLLEIELGRPIERQRPHHGTTSIKGLNYDTDWYVAWEMLGECRGNSSVHFEKAVKACLYPDILNEKSHRRHSFGDPFLQQKTFEMIVQPLENTLKNVFDISIERVDDWSPPSESQSPKHFARSFLSAQNEVLPKSRSAPGVTRHAEVNSTEAQAQSHSTPGPKQSSIRRISNGNAQQPNIHLSSSGELKIEQWHRDITLYAGFGPHWDEHWKPAVALFDTGTSGDYISLDMVDRLGFSSGFGMKRLDPSETRKSVAFNGTTVIPDRQISLLAKGPWDYDQCPYTFVVIINLPVNIIFGRKTISQRGFAIPNPDSRLCRDGRKPCRVTDT